MCVNKEWRQQLIFKSEIINFSSGSLNSCHHVINTMINQRSFRVSNNNFRMKGHEQKPDIGKELRRILFTTNEHATSHN